MVICMSHTDVAREANLVGALGLVVADRLAEAADPQAAGSAAEALVTLHGTGGGLSIHALAQIVGLSHSGTVRLVDRLQAAGLVERRAGADQRSTSLRLTVSGRRAARRALARREAAVQELLAPLAPADRESVARLSELLLAGAARTAGERERVCRLCDREACERRHGSCPVRHRSSEQ
jgi:MarR family transcriptional regulator, negative regulator of the multidrug operon emrRAB